MASVTPYKINFNCVWLEQDYIGINDAFDYVWVCKKRGSIFVSIYDHCYDCEQYQKMLAEVKKVLEND